jgi:hypothetical protein
VTTSSSRKGGDSLPALAALALANEARQDIQARRIAAYQEIRHLGLTQHRAAVRVGVSPSTIRRYEAHLAYPAPGRPQGD